MDQLAWPSVNGYVWVTNYGSGSLMQIEPSVAVVNTFKVGKAPSSVVFDGSSLGLQTLATTPSQN
jgi:hypothetical protein